ncbi:hypothetical protein PGN35_007335 [Nodosilinea sp. PGN35]|uniref:hypothetical protein n=1 Tax=Nodosilinea sp. PGN35 TaxID=3020489 RepID=UPI0023B3547A|nr:hypothetical protein [Nodosilinea sp. TSF1-S3]MDF0367085.1 hypothetical protein [Nodosilinea sp. TSF1-S3]
MAQATVQSLPSLTTISRTVNCTDCLTRNCSMAGAIDYPVQRCTSYRQANCYLCGKADCTLNGKLESPVMACAQFVPLALP